MRHEDFGIVGQVKISKNFLEKGSMVTQTFVGEKNFLENDIQIFP